MKMRDFIYEHGKTLESIAKELGVSKQRVYAMLYAKYPRFESVSKLAKAIGCDEQEIYNILKENRKEN